MDAERARIMAMLGSEPDPALDRLAALAGRLVGSRVALVSVVTDAGQDFLGESGLSSAGFPGVRGTPLEQSLCVRVVDREGPLVLDDPAADPDVGPAHGAVADLGVRAYAGVPLHAGGRTVGALCALELEPRRWTEGEVATLEDLARTAEALLEARLAAHRATELAERERRTAEALQDALLPDALPEIPGLRIAGAYRPSEDRVGGDWYDVLPLAGGTRVAFALGDVVGHGLEAATAAGRLRTAFQTHLLVDADPAAVLTRLNDLATLRQPLAYSSVVAGVLDLATGELTGASAGHPPAVVVQDGRAHVGLVAGNPVLAADPAQTTFTARTDHLGSGDGLVLYSDGLVDERTGRLEARFELLREVTERAWGDPERVVAELLAAMRAEPGPDDVAVLVLQREP